MILARRLSLLAFFLPVCTLEVDTLLHSFYTIPVPLSSAAVAMHSLPILEQVNLEARAEREMRTVGGVAIIQLRRLHSEFPSCYHNLH